MDCFTRSFLCAKKYPLELVSPRQSDYLLKENFERLNKEEERLFDQDGKLNVGLLELERGCPSLGFLQVENDTQLQQRLRRSDSQEQCDPLYRAVFFQARSSRDPLSVTRDMFTSVLSHHQVMPVYLDHLFPFGDQENAKDAHFSSFRAENSLSNFLAQQQIPELGRSGLQIQMCYNLRSVEFKKTAHGSPWSIRQAAVYHSFDVKFGRAVWIIIKANSLLRKRIQETASGNRGFKFTNLDTVESAFQASMMQHQVIHEWCTEGWRRYLEHLEEITQEATSDATVAEMEAPTSDREVLLSKFQRSLTFSSLQRQDTGRLSRLAHRSTGFGLRSSRPVLPSTDQAVPLLSLHESKDFESNFNTKFSLKDLQRVQHLVEKVNEVIFVLGMNKHILEKISKYYQSLIKKKDLPDKLKQDCEDAVTEFAEHSDNAISDLAMLESRATALHQLLKERKELLLCVVEHTNMTLNLFLGKEAQKTAIESHKTAIEMKYMAQQMSDVSFRTEQETIFMRIITVVTLLFLPSTFISSLMSTDIVQWPSDSGKPRRVFVPQALGTFFAISAPITFITFPLSYVSHCIEQRRLQQRRQNNQSGQ
ncbi:hypothetical protein BT63DRAFT_421197 [Microthyrium microscopicum]|uniref:CorA-like transporter domain-containing protein n=1 Tax=Microthyrium microscopicum TaxID=703497 RepID=A0A6A6UNJ2_9PEZI|nr:hypothetical protein BT63DRAFT_421197 [Microthyrium microscopicum]